jgi:alpha-tubulin suppressor-like RCC1 family protein
MRLPKWIQISFVLVVVLFASLSCNTSTPVPLGTSTSSDLLFTSSPVLTDTVALSPTQTPTITSTPIPRLFAQQVTAGSESTYAVTLSGGAMCWGNNPAGLLGDGTNEVRLYPVDVVGLSSGIKKISLGDDSACALTNNGGVKCWGSNSYGKLGNNFASGFTSSVPFDVEGLSSGVVDISVGLYHACAVLNTGAVKCWGNNYMRQLGNPVKNYNQIPVDVEGLTDVIGIDSGWYHTCAVLKDGRVKCWGGKSIRPIGSCSYKLSFSRL